MPLSIYDEDKDNEHIKMVAQDINQGPVTDTVNKTS